MKAEELFTGALVRVNRDGLCIKKDTIVEVRGIDADKKLAGKGLVGAAHCRPFDDDQFEGGIWCEYLDPIPLTPEILEKNGFIYKKLIYKKLKGVGDNEIWRIEEDYYDIDIYEWSDSIWIFRYDCNEMNFPHTQVTISYVHELQHALRLCGINKEMIL